MKTNITPDKSLVSVCGLFCPACGIYYSTQENNVENLKKIAIRINVPFEEIRCNGCRTEVITAYCKNCFMKKCAAEKGIDFCGECNEYPCTELKEFQSKLPHRAELWKSQERIKEIGWENWFNEMIDYFSCNECESLNGWYDFKCRECGTIPGNDFVKNNLEVLKTAIPGK
jgi:hypothetical protein